MKLFTKILVVVSVIAFYSCEKDEEAARTEFETQLDIGIPITSENSEHSGELKSTSKHDFSFSGSENYTFSDIVNSNEEVNNIYGIKSREGTVLTIPGIELLEEVESLTLSWRLTSLNSLDLDMVESIDLLTLNHTLTAGELKINLDEISEKILMEIKNPLVLVQFSISGKSAFNLDCIASLHIPVAVESTTYSPSIGIF